MDQDTASGLAGIDLVDHRQFGLGQVLVPAELLQHANRELRISVLDLRIFGRTSIGQQADLHRGAVGQLLLALDAEARTEHTAAIHRGEVCIVEQRRAGMFDLGRAPARPRQAVVVALVRALRRPLGEHVEVGLVRHMRLDALRRLAAVAGRPAAAIHFAENVLGDRQVVLDLDVLEHLVGKAALLGDAVHDLEIVLGFENRLDDLFAPLHRAI